MRKFVLLLTAFALLFACKSTPPTQEELAELAKISIPELMYKSIEGKDRHNVVLHYQLKAENPLAVPVTVTIKKWKTIINGIEIDPMHAVLHHNRTAFSGYSAELSRAQTLIMDFELHLNLIPITNAISNSDDNEAVPAADFDTFETELSFEIVGQYKAEPPVGGVIATTAEFPRIREPVFTITSIAIMQAELINTRFAVNLRMDNPNRFPIKLSSFKYDLYGQGMFWSGGKEQNVFVIPGKDAAETKMILVMNFIDMKRGLLDQIIAMRQVNYRFTGTVEVETGIQWCPQFSLKFDRSGPAEVIK